MKSCWKEMRVKNNRMTVDRNTVFGRLKSEVLNAKILIRSTVYGLRFTIAFSLLLLISIQLLGQNKTPILERNITIRVTNEKLGPTLNKIAQQGGFSFSYNPSIIDANRIVTVNVTNKSVREVLTIIFKGKIEYKAKGNYIILQKAKEETGKPETKNETFIVSGYVTDDKGEKIQWASIYDKTSLASTVTNSYGFYKISLNRDQTAIVLNVSKQDYLDTAIEIKTNSTQFLNFTLTKKPESIVFNAPRIDAIKTPKEIKKEEDVLPPSLISPENLANTKNIKDTIYRKAQISFIPFAGTNGRLSANVINDYSINVFGGYSMGTRKLELAGFFNADRSNVSGVQAAGFVNLVGGNVKHFQAAGFTNTVKQSVSGFQSAGFANIVGENQSGAQFAGFGNIVAGDQKGAQFGGFTNIVRGKAKGAQFAGFSNSVLLDSANVFQMAGYVNFAYKHMNGMQMAGFANIAGDTSKGLQLAGFGNIAAQSLTGSQIAGFTNITLKEITGSQVAGFFNYAKKVNGTQIGFFNYSDTVKGVPIGFLSYVNKGYHKIEISGDEIFYTNIAFRTGVRSFHNIITAGIRPSPADTFLWSFGYGVGTTFRITKGVDVDFDLTFNQVQKGSIDAVHFINKAYLGVDVPLTPKFSIAIGGTVNGELSKGEHPDIFTEYKPHFFHEETFNKSNLHLKMWYGGKIALRFL